MWILPKQLHTLAYVPDTAALISDLAEQSQICEQSLLARSKPSLARTWSQKWKRDSWTQHLSGRILKPSHGQSFVTAWTSSLEVIPASHSQQQASDSDETTLDTSGLGSQMELFPCDQESASLKTSRDTSALDSERSSANWKALVIKRRGEYSLRVKSVHLTNVSGSLSWPTATTRDHKGPSARAYKGHPENLSDITMMCWPTPTTAEAGKISCCPNYGQLGLSNHPDVHGYQVNRPKLGKSRSGQAAPVSPSTDGNRQESWATPEAKNHVGYQVGADGKKWPRLGSQVKDLRESWPTPCANNPNEGETLESWDRRQALNRAKHNNGNGAGTPLAIKVKQEQWATPSTMDHINVVRNPEERSPAANKGGCKNLREEVHQWATPNTMDHLDCRSAEGVIKIATGARKGRSMPSNLREQVDPQTVDIYQKTKEDSWATPRAGATDNSRPNNKGGIPLGDQARREEQWATPQSRDAKGAEGRMIRGGQYSDLPSQTEVAQTGQWNRDNGKLNPRWVETLMGLPIGWTMPSCSSPLTIELTSCDCLEMESSQPLQPELF